MKKASTGETLIAIPDISGFSAFVSDTEARHSRHIITELLELILEHNALRLKVSEIEGDAVLFYLPGPVPSAQAVWEWARGLYIRFHEHLLAYERQRLCECGACRTAHKLELKFILTLGAVDEVAIGKHRKLMGRAVIEAHRLLKNDVPSDAYLLVSSPLASAFGQMLPTPPHVSWQEACTSYPDVGDLHYQFVLLDSLHKEVKTPESRKDAFSTRFPVVRKGILPVDAVALHQVISDSTQKVHWMKGVNEVIPPERSGLARVGARHVCVMEGQKLDLEAFAHTRSGKTLEFVEALTHPNSLLKKLAMIYKIEPRDDGTAHLRIELHYRLKGWLRPMDLVMRPLMGYRLRQSLGRLETYLLNITEQPGSKK